MCAIHGQVRQSNLTFRPLLVDVWATQRSARREGDGQEQKSYAEVHRKNVRGAPASDVVVSTPSRTMMRLATCGCRVDGECVSQPGHRAEQQDYREVPFATAAISLTFIEDAP